MLRVRTLEAKYTQTHVNESYLCFHRGFALDGVRILEGVFGYSAHRNCQGFEHLKNLMQHYSYKVRLKLEQLILSRPLL